MDEWDCITCQFHVAFQGEVLPGISYVTEVDPAVSVSHEEFPRLPLKSIGLSSRVADVKYVLDDIETLGIKQSISGMEMPRVLTTQDTPDAIEYRCNGKNYYFRKDQIDMLDAYMKPLAEKNIPVIMRYQNPPYLCPETPEEIVDIIIHPDYDYDYPSAYMSSFNLRTEEGVEYFIACTQFFMERYASGDRKKGIAYGIEVANEVTSAYIWNNQGEMTAWEAMKEYTSVLRITWLLAKKYCENFRVYTSFDQYFAGRHVPAEPLRFYGMKECINYITEHCHADGDFPWNIATHPYPENLSYPDFWNDRDPRWNFETTRITFKNIEVLPAYLAKEEFLYKGQPRHIAFTEQGFNTRTEAPYTELQAKYGYVLAYLKMRKLETIDMFQYYPYMDNPWEFGLNLGFRYFGSYVNDEQGQIPGGPKPVFEAIMAMDSPDEAKIVAEARDYIGHEIFDFILNPPPVTEAPSGDGGLTMPHRGINNKKGREAMKRRELLGAKEEQNFST